LIHLTGGRIETHFHIFGSLAFLAFYRDWRVLVPATVIVAGDHFFRGIYWPQSVYGVLAASPWRWVEHAFWVLFEDVFLVISMRQSVEEMLRIAKREAQREATNEEIKAREMALRVSEEKYRHIVNAAADAIVSLDEDGRIIEFNEAAERMFGYRKSEVLGKLLTLCIPTRFQDLHATAIDRYRSNGSQECAKWENLEFVGLTREGHEFTLEASVSTCTIGDRYVLTGVFRNITERKRVQEELHLAKESAEASSRLKSSFLANMSHEIRTPMGAILGFCELLRGRIAADGVGLEQLVMIERSGHHLLEIINDILDLSKIEAGQLEVEKTYCAPIEIAVDVFSAMAVRAAEKDLLLRQVYETAIPDTILSDPTRIRQALINIVGNAVKFTNEGSVVLLMRYTDRGEGSGILEFIVKDTGIGIPEDKLERLFKPFSQVDPSTTRKYGGSGLGLSISYRLAQLLGGELTVKSQPGLGSLFRFAIHCELPDGVSMIEAPGNLAVKREAPLPPSPRMEVEGRLLVVEDTPENQELICSQLERAGFAVELAENGEIALEKCSEKEFDLVIMDIQMPVMDGFEALAELRLRGVKSPVIALTAHAMLGYQERCLKAGFTGYLSKPVRGEDLLSTVSAVLKKERTVVQAQADKGHAAGEESEPL